MIKYYKLNEKENIKEIKDSKDFPTANILKVIEPQYEDIYRISKKENVIHEYLKDSLDKNEIPRLENYKNQLFILIRVPVQDDLRPESTVFRTVPVGIIITKEKLIIISVEDTNITDVVMNNYGKRFDSIRSFALFIMLASIKRYLKYLKNLHMRIIRAEDRLRRTQSNDELINLMEIEKSLVYFTTSIKGNQMLMERLLIEKKFELTERESVLIQSMMIENNQALEMSQIYNNILTSLTNAFASIISNNLNIVMKALAALTIILNFPMLVSSIYGMNVPLPFQEQKYAFIIVVTIGVGLTILSTWLLIKRKWF